MAICEQVETKGEITLGEDQKLTPTELALKVMDYLPAAKYISLKSKEYIVYNNILLLIKQITYLGNPHPQNKKRIQIPTDWKNVYELAINERYSPRYIGIYTYNGNTIFVDFNPEIYLQRDGWNSSAHIAVDKIQEATIDGKCEFRDKNGNYIVALRASLFGEYLKTTYFNIYQTGSISRSIFNNNQTNYTEEIGGTMQEDENNIDITPPVQIYDYFKHLSYEPHYALAEFIDNSTQSFYNHEEELSDIHSVTHPSPYVTVRIKIADDSIIIDDNAFGMNRDDFKRAMQLARVPQNTDGRNEFGMGLKTAACWFGDKFTVTTTQKNCSKELKCTLDLEQLNQTNSHTLPIIESEVERKCHGTVIKIEKLSHKLNHGNKINKLQKELTSIYRHDIRNGKLKLIINDHNDNNQNLEYEPPKILEDNGKTWKKEFEFTVENEAVTQFNNYHQDNPLNLKCSGFVGLLETGSTTDAGFTLIRRGRVIEANYRPESVVGRSNDFAYQRVFGEINMDGFPVTQAKDKFDWQFGIEEDFINALKNEVSEYVKQARLYRKRKTADMENITENMLADLSESTIISSVSITKNVTTDEAPTERGNTVVNINNNAQDADVQLINCKNWNIDLQLQNGGQYQINLVYDDSLTSMNNWLDIEITNETKNSVICKLNTRHAFFRPFTEKPDFIKTLAEIALCQTIAELECYKIADNNGKVEPNAVRYQMNQILNDIHSSKWQAQRDLHSIEESEDSQED